MRPKLLLSGSKAKDSTITPKTELNYISRFTKVVYSVAWVVGLSVVLRFKIIRASSRITGG